ncbi:MAG TPA: glucose-6-phosphate dehydrogenase assembly protein OpcA [Thermoanaerobaculia bacterium]|nr:glucose-6-phosphate dehydrogenase assembly protein OpcA [Thermoanaerobaculia bacterium]
MAQAVAGEDVHVDVTTIEKQLADLWRAEKQNESGAVTRAALWNVVAHTWSADQHAQATEVLARASASVPQRTIVIQADPRGHAGISSWISANCHLIGGGRQVCSEEVSIVAAGDHVHHVAPLVKSLLLPDMPVAVWWVGDLPAENREYAETLLEPADRLIVDSSEFNGLSDLALVSRIAERTTTAPADLNWARLEEWRAATATLFDPMNMRERLRTMRAVEVTCGGNGFGASAAAMLFAAWLNAQGGANAKLELLHDSDATGIRNIELHFADGTKALIRRERDGGAVVAHSEAAETPLDCIARPLAQSTEDLIVRLLKRPQADRVYLKALKMALHASAG